MPERMSVEKIWEVLTPLAEKEEVKIFDIEPASGPAGVLRVYIYSGEARSSKAGLEQCTRLSKKILDLECIEEMIPGQCTLEVSTPGINRRLRRPEHFEEALGERVRLTVRYPEGKKGVLRGVIKSAAEGSLEVDDEASQEVVRVALDDVSEARVDFLFK